MSLHNFFFLWIYSCIVICLNFFWISFNEFFLILWLLCFQNFWVIEFFLFAKLKGKKKKKVPKGFENFQDPNEKKNTEKKSSSDKEQDKNSENQGKSPFPGLKNLIIFLLIYFLIFLNLTKYLMNFFFFKI